jgi:hypothetical protein
MMKKKKENLRTNPDAARILRKRWSHERGLEIVRLFTVVGSLLRCDSARLGDDSAVGLEVERDRIVELVMHRHATRK